MISLTSLHRIIRSTTRYSIPTHCIPHFSFFPTLTPIVDSFKCHDASARLSFTSRRARVRVALLLLLLQAVRVHHEISSALLRRSSSRSSDRLIGTQQQQQQQQQQRRSKPPSTVDI
ncbi:hypothetical protein BOTBODRAFT_236718 [Botryobasidium botryosum FD-172 SS1]|uniref:Uncharacterized protein n=1 Tax=Botryobasidium botryosum (strain FD-172 SS1) TaxID=930990 RepID=A0A067MYK9_BOTB1|nr:hypothetical protein BOTBODRAFT_236718 [Botryobasidium botryosum FD-172 SS1]